MPSTYSNIKIQLMAAGENNTTWGNVTNANLGTAIEEAIVGSADVTFASGNVTLTLTDSNATQTARNMRLRCTGTTGGATRNLIVPSIQKPYIVQNDCADSIVVKNATGTGITVPAGKTMWVYNNGTNVVDAVTHLSSLTLSTPLPTSSGGTGSTASLTQGSVVFSGAAGVFSQDNANFFWDNANDRLGIGTATPSYRFEARTDAASGFNYIGSVNTTATGAFGAGFLARAGSGFSYFYMRGDGLAYLENATANPLAFATNGTEQMRITASGEALLGLTTAYQTLANAQQLQIGNPLTTPGSGISLGATTTSDIAFADNTTGVAQYAGLIRYSHTSDVMSLWTNSTERMRITSGGDVGIGTVSPTSKLHVDGTVQARVGATGVQIYGDGGAGYVNSVGANPLILQVNSSERMRVTSAGDVGIGTTPTGKLDVNGNIRTTVGSGGTLALFETNATRANQLVAGADAFGSYITASFATGGSAVLRFNTAADERMRITAAGDVGIGTVSPANKLHVVGSNANTLRIDNAGQQFTSADWYNANSSRASIYYDNVGAEFVTRTTVSAGLGFDTNLTRKMTITAAGDVGIGTASPTAKLDVSGTLRANSLTLTTALPVAQGGTGATDAGTARSNLSAAATGAVTTSGITMSTARMLGRTTASTGAIEEITIGSGLSLSGGTLSSTAGGGTVTSVSGTGTVNGITLTGTVSSSGSLTLGGALSGVSLTTQVSGTLPLANGGTNATDAAGARSSLGAAASGVVTSSGLTMSTARILGRTTAATGAIEEVTIGSGLSLSGGTLIATASGGSVTSVGMTVPAFLSVTPASITTSGTFAVTLSGTALPIANGGTGATDAGAALTALGAYPASNPSGYTSNAGTVTSVGGTGSVNGITLSGTVSSSGNLTLGGSLSGVSLTTQVSGTLPIANGGTGSTSTAYCSLASNVTGTLPIANGGTGSASTAYCSLTANVSGILPVGNGGTGATTLTGIVVGNGTSAFTAVTAPAGAIVGTTDTQNLSNKTLTIGNVLDAGTSVSDTGTITATSPGFRGLPQNAKTTSYTLALADAGKDIYISGTTAAQTITIPANGSVPFPTGTILQITNDSNQNWSIAITTDTLLWSPNNVTGTRTLAAAGQVTIRKVTSTRWWISGVGLT